MNMCKIWKECPKYCQFTPTTFFDEKVGIFGNVTSMKEIHKLNIQMEEKMQQLKIHDV